MVIQDFFKTIAVHLAVNSVSEVIEAQSALVLRRVPKKAKPKSPSGLSRLVSSSSHDIDKDVQVLQDVSAICDVFFFFLKLLFWSLQHVVVMPTGPTRRGCDLSQQLCGCID